MTAATGLMTGMLLAFAAPQPPASIEAVMAEPDLEKRSDRALQFAHGSLDGARKAYDAGDLAAMRKSLATTLEGVDLSWDSLQASGKNPRRSPKYFKRAEIEVRKLLKRLTDLRETVGVDDRPIVAEAQTQAAKAHDRLVAAIMSKR